MITSPASLKNERPSLYADRVGEWYANQTSDDHKSEHGQYLTPPAVAEFMAGLASAPSKTIHILDPGAGSGILSCALCESLASCGNKPNDIELVVYETEFGLLKHLSSVLEYLKSWLSSAGIELTFTLHASDFILENAACLDPRQTTLFGDTGDFQRYDFIISNPPYFKISKNDPRSRACLSVIHGQPNIYALFMAVSAHMLKPGGELIYITPRSFAAGPYFRLFREKFFEIARPLQLHLFGSRTDAFDRSEVLQENVILHAVRDDGWNDNVTQTTVRVSFSAGVRDIAAHGARRAPISEIMDVKSHNRFLHIPTSDDEQEIIHLVNSWPGSLHKHGLEISTGPVVPFRATQFITNENGSGKVPLLWMQNVKSLCTTWPVLTRKQQYIISSDATASLLLPNKNYVLLRRFSAKEEERRLTAAPYLADNVPFDVVGFENHLNYVYRQGGELSKEEAYGIAALLNCRLLDTYFRSYNGNTQVSATELRLMPLPSMEIVRLIGKEAAKGKLTTSEIDSWISEMLVQSGEATIDKATRCASNPSGAGITARTAK